MSMKSEALFYFCLRLGDNALIHAQRLSEWTGHGPFLEEDLALTNISLDMLGRADALLNYAGRVEGVGRDGDRLAFHRSEREFLNTLLVELPNGDYARTILRLCITAAFDLHFYTALMNSRDETIAGIAAKAVKEIKYHKRHANAWVQRFAGGTEESRKRIGEALQELWSFTADMFESNAGDQTLAQAGIAPDLKGIQETWEKEMNAFMASCGLSVPANVHMQSGSREGKHSEHLGYILAEMQYLPRAYPDAKW